jgi:hypothetical protein
MKGILLEHRGRLIGIDEKPQYVEIGPLSREDLEAAFASENENTVCNAMFSAAQHELDWRWAQGRLLQFLNHKSLLLRSTAVNALGELLLFRGHVDIELVLPEIHKLSGEPALAPFVKEYLEDLKSRVTIN